MSTYQKQVLKFYIRLLLYIDYKYRNKYRNTQKPSPLIEYLNTLTLEEQISKNKSLHDGDKDLLNGPYSLDETYYKIINEKYQPAPKTGPIAVSNSGADSTNDSNDSDSYDDNEDDDDVTKKVTKLHDIYKHIVRNVLRKKSRNQQLELEKITRNLSVFEYKQLIEIFQDHRFKSTPITETRSQIQKQEVEREYGYPEVDSIIVDLNKIKMKSFERATAVSPASAPAASAASAPAASAASAPAASAATLAIASAPAPAASEAVLEAARATRAAPAQKQAWSSPAASVSTQAPTTLTTASSQGPVTRLRASALASASASAQAVKGIQTRLATSKLMSKGTALDKIKILVGPETIKLFHRTKKDDLDKLNETFSKQIGLESLIKFKETLYIKDGNIFNQNFDSEFNKAYNKAYKEAIGLIVSKVLPSKTARVPNLINMAQREALTYALNLLKDNIKTNIKELYEYEDGSSDFKEHLESIINELRYQDNP